MIIKAAAENRRIQNASKLVVALNGSTTQMAKNAKFASNLKPRINEPAKPEYMIRAINNHPKVDS